VKMFIGGDDNSVVVKFHPRLYWDASLLPRPERSYWVSRIVLGEPDAVRPAGGRRGVLHGAP
jgi:hypothetical protein